ncbi:MAG: aldo/keto reductase [Bacillota bacterium]|nr:aldo/keto reductase [Bacillota bacterium]
MDYRILGKTGLKVSVVGFGGIPLNNVPMNDAVKLVNRALDLGVNFFDTARCYGQSEEKMGEALKSRRNECYIATKSLERTKKDIIKELDTSLRNLKTDYIDLYQIHDLRKPEDYSTVMSPGGALEAVLDAKKEGKIKHIGVSSHQPTLIVQAVRTGYFETVQIPYNIIDFELFQDVLPVANGLNMGIIIMKPFSGGLFKDASKALRFVLSHPITTVIPGMASVNELEENVKVCENASVLTEAELEQLKKEADRLGKDFCRRCGYCLPCPQGIDIPTVFRYERYFDSYYQEAWAREQYEWLPIKADECIECGKCESKCPYELHIKEKLKSAHKKLI